MGCVFIGLAGGFGRLGKIRGGLARLGQIGGGRIMKSRAKGFHYPFLNYGFKFELKTA